MKEIPSFKDSLIDEKNNFKIRLKRVKVINYKNFKSFNVELDNFNVIIGANATGKTNFINFFKFVKDLRTQGLVKALDIHGGRDYFRNIIFGRHKKFSMELNYEVVNFNQKAAPSKRKEDFSLVGLDYLLKIQFLKGEPNYEIIDEKIIYHLELKQKTNKYEKGFFEIERKRDEFSFNCSKNFETISRKEKELMDILFNIFRYLPSDKILITLLPLLSLLLLNYNIKFKFEEGELFKQIKIYNFNPVEAKKTVPLSSTAILETDGSNLAIVLDEILRDKEKKRKLNNLLKFILPFVDDLNTEKIYKSISYKLKERYNEDYLPSPLLSDGTIGIIALVIALFFEDSLLTIIEEPERNLHPFLISELVELLKDASNNKQVLISTHNPEILKHVSIENIILISRNEAGYSTISRPSEKRDIQQFLESEMGLEELFVNRILEQLE